LRPQVPNLSPIFTFQAGLTNMATTTEIHTTAQRRVNRRAGALSAAAILVLAWSSAAQATPFVEARAIAGAASACVGAGCGSVDDIERGLTGPQHATASSIGVLDESGSATATVSYGVMHLYSQFTNGGIAQGIGDIHDDMVFTAPGVATGTQMQITFGILVEGQLGSTGPQISSESAGEWNLHAGIGGGALPLNGSGQQFSTLGLVGDPLGFFTATETVQAGFSTPLDIELNATANASNGGSAVADLADTLEWGGISKVTVGGVAIDDFSVTSASGTNWADSFIPGPGVPEPATWAMMLVGFGGLGGLLRRGRAAVPA
jgi:hypothetical protein